MKTPTARKLNSGQWRVQLQIGGERISVTRSSKSEAEKEAALLKVEYQNGIRSSVGGNITLSVALDKYISARENVLSPSTVRGYKEIRRNRFQSVMNKPLTKISWQSVVNREAKLCSPKTLKNSFGLIRSVYKEAGLELPPVRLPAPEKKERAFLSPEEIIVFLDAVKGQPCEIPALLALSSLRKSELLALDWKNVDMENRIIHVRGAAVRGSDNSFVQRDQNKTLASVRDVPMIPQLYDALAAVEDRSGLVIRCHYQTPYKQVQRVCERNNLPNVGLHGLRHSFASLCYSLGLSELETMKMGGWSDFAVMRKIYTHLAESDREKSADKFTDFFKNAHENAHEK